MRGFPSVAFTHSPRTRQVGALKVRPKVVLCTNARLCKYCGVSAHMLMDSQGVPRCIFHPQSTPEAQTHTPTRAFKLCNKQKESASQRQAKLSSPRTVLCCWTCPGKILIGMNWTVGLAKAKLLTLKLHGVAIAVTTGIL